MALTPNEAYAAKQPFVDKETLEHIVEQFPTPFHLYDEAGIRRNMQGVRDAFAWNPGFKEYFAVKANPNPALISILNEYGCGCDCSSYTELMIARSLGITGHDIMFSSNDTPAADFELADKLGAIVNFDDISHIEFFERVAGPIPKTVSCRFNPGGLFQLSNGIMDNPGDSKYGMTTEQLFEAFHMLKAKAPRTLASTHSLPATPSPTTTTPSLRASSLSLPCAWSARPAHMSPSSICPAVWVSPTCPSSRLTTFTPSVRAYTQPTTRFWSPPAWAMWRSAPRWVAL